MINYFHPLLGGWIANLSSTQHVFTIFKGVFQDQKLLLFIAGGALVVLGYSQINSTLPQFINMNVEDGVILFSYVIIANSITVLAFQLPLTMMIEKMSIYASLKMSILIFSVGLFLFGLSHSAWMFIASMIVFSIGEIFCFPMMNAVIEEIAPEDQKGTYLGASQLKNIGGFIGPIFGGWLLTAATDFLFAIVAAVLFSSLFIYRKALKTV